MARKFDTGEIKPLDDLVDVLADGQVLIHYEPRRSAQVVGTYRSAGKSNYPIVFWGDKNDLPEQREALIGDNNVVPQIIRAKRDIIIGGGLAAYTERIEDGKRIIEEVAMPAQFTDFVEMQEELWGGLEVMCNDLLKHGNYFVQFIRNTDGEVATMKPHMARLVRAQQQDQQGRIPRYWVYGGWGKVQDQQRLSEVQGLIDIQAYNPTETQTNFMYHGADKLLGGPYYYDPHYAGSDVWIKVANMIPMFHESNLRNGFNIRYLIKVPEDYFMRSLSDEKRKDTERVIQHLAAAKKAFKDKLNEFLAGAENAGRGLIITKHFYKHLQKEWPELEIVPLQVDLKDTAMLNLFDSSNSANTSAHGIPPALAGLATGAKLTSGNEIRNLYNFWQITSTPIPRKILKRPYEIAWKSMNLPADVKLGFRNIELTTTDKNPTGAEPPQIAEENAV